MPLIVEIKAHCSDPLHIQNMLEDLDAEFKGVDHQIDTYFLVPNGRLKLREGNIENALIHYHRDNQAEPKQSEVILYQAPTNPNLKAALTAALGIKTIVDKQRRIYFIDNVKFHIDDVKGLGSFVEIEAIDMNSELSTEVLQAQCEKYIETLGIKKEDLLKVSYSDLIMLA